MKKLINFIYLQYVSIKKIGLKQYIRYQFSFKQKLVDLRINKFNIIVRKGTPDLEVAINSLYEEFEILRYLLPRNYKGKIVDAGGYIGTAAIVLSDMFPSSKIITIEPSKHNIKILKKNIGSQKNIEIVYGALVGEKIKKIPLKNRGTGEWGFTVVDKPLDVDKTLLNKLHDSPAYRIKDLGLVPEDIGILKLDIEGGEFNLLKYDSQTLNKINIIFAEMHDRIVRGCTNLFFDLSKNRILIKNSGEKYLSIKKNISHN